MLSLTEFQTTTRAEGFDEIVERRWGALGVQDTHTHPFAVKAFVSEGEMWLTVDGQTRHLAVGDTFELSRGIEHAERYGAEGATYWAARRN
jgi:hypothetical protein